VEGWRASAGQALLVPLHVSAVSQAPMAARQVAPDVMTASVGQDAEEPVQLSAASQPPLAARQTVPEVR